MAIGFLAVSCVIMLGVGFGIIPDGERPDRD